MEHRIKEMSKAEFEAEKDVLYQLVEVCFPEARFEIDYEESFSIGEDMPRIIIRCYDDWFENIVEMAFSRGQQIKDMKEKYGEFAIEVRKYERDLVRNVKLGDFVLIEDERGNTSPGIVTSIMDSTDGPLYGCSYLVVDLSSDYRVKLTSDCYGGYHCGFKDKLGPEDVVEALKDMVEVDFKEKMERLQKDKETIEKSIPRLVEKLESSDHMVPTASIRFKAGMYIPNADIDRSMQQKFSFQVDR